MDEMVDLEYWLFANVLAGEQEWSDLRRAVRTRVSCGLFKVKTLGDKTLVHGPINCLCLETEANRLMLLPRLCPAKWFLIGSVDGKDGQCRVDH